MMRRYNRWWSRFDQPDPYDGSYNLTDPQSSNRYSYVQNDPVNFVDPSGLNLEDPNGSARPEPLRHGNGFWSPGIHMTTVWKASQTSSPPTPDANDSWTVGPALPFTLIFFGGGGSGGGGGGGDSRLLDGVQTGLDVVGISEIPVVSSVADLCNAGISFARGDNVGGGLSLAAAIPGAGAAANAVRLGRTGKSIWTATKSKSAAQNALRHFNDHGKEFGAVNSLDYVRQTHNFLNSPPSGTLTKTRSNGDVLMYHHGTNTFGVMDALGQPRTMFKPTDGMCYWNKQK